jgi:hypothetical protein
MRNKPLVSGNFGRDDGWGVNCIYGWKMRWTGDYEGVRPGAWERLARDLYIWALKESGAYTILVLRYTCLYELCL